MECKTTSTRARAAGFTLMEMMVSVGLGMLALAAICWAVMYTSRAYVAMGNYLDLDQKSQQALNLMSRELRQAAYFSSFASNDFTIVDNSGATVEYKYDSANQVLNRIAGGATNVYLTGCDSLLFTIYERAPVSGTYEPYTASSYTNAKLIQIDWHCYRNIMAASANTESIQSAKVEIRNH